MKNLLKFFFFFPTDTDRQTPSLSEVKMTEIKMHQDRFPLINMKWTMSQHPASIPKQRSSVYRLICPFLILRSYQSYRNIMEHFPVI